MSEFLIIHYRPTLAGGHKSAVQGNMLYWALGGDQHPSITLGHGELRELKAIARGKKVSVLIDSSFTTLESLNIPSKNRSKQLQAIPFAMEDLLAEDIDEMHFALGKSDADKVPVIAIKRELLQQTLDTFKQHQIHIELITADSVALPDSATQWCILLDENSALIKIDHYQTHSCDRENLAVILQALLEQNEKPESINYYHKESDEAAESLLADIDVTINSHCYKNHSLEIFIQNLNNTKSFNLLQGDFTPKRESNAWLQPWKSVAAVTAVWIILQLGNAGIISSQLEDKNLALTRLIETEFKQAIPDARKMTNMLKRVERRLDDLKSGGKGSNKNGFLQILSKTSPVFAKNDLLNINAAVYRNNYIDVDLTAKTLQSIEQTKSELDKLGGIKTVLSTTVEKGSVKARLRLEAKG